MSDQPTCACGCGCGAPVSPGARFVRGHNLPQYRGELPAGAWKPGAVVHLKGGARSRVLTTDQEAEYVEAVELSVPLRGPDGEVLPSFRLAVEAGAMQLVRVRRLSAYLDLHGDTDERGRFRRENEQLERALVRLFAMLEKLGATPRSYAALGFDVARTAATVDAAAALSAARSEPDAGRRAALYRAAGVDVEGDADAGE